MYTINNSINKLLNKGKLPRKKAPKESYDEEIIELRNLHHLGNIEIAKRTGLPLSKVCHIVNRLLAHGKIERVGNKRSAQERLEALGLSGTIFKA